MKNRGKRYAAEATKDVGSRRDFKRDQEIKDILSKELGMEPPDSFHKAMGAIYAELPRDMPVHHYPLRSAAKSLCTVAVFLLVAGASLLWANAVYPQLTESLPGLGPVFVAINGPEPVQETIDEQPNVMQKRAMVVPQGWELPAFTPVTFTDKTGDIGQLTIEDAWTDGSQIYMEVKAEIEMPYLLDLYNAIILAQGEENDQPPDRLVLATPNGLEALRGFQGEDAALTPSTFTVNGETVTTVQWVESGSWPTVWYDDAGTRFPSLCLSSLQEDVLTYEAVWRMDVPTAAGGEEELKISLDIDTLYTVTDIMAPLHEMGLGFEGDFTH